MQPVIPLLLNPAINLARPIPAAQEYSSNPPPIPPPPEKYYTNTEMCKVSRVKMYGRHAIRAPIKRTSAEGGRGRKGSLVPCQGYYNLARNCVKRRLVTVESPSRSPLGEGGGGRFRKVAGALCKSAEVNSNIIPLDFSIFLPHALAIRAAGIYRMCVYVCVCVGTLSLHRTV